MSKKNIPAEIARLEDARKALADAKRTYNACVKSGEKAVKSAQKAHDKAVENARRQLQDENARYTSPIARFDSASLFRDHLDYQGLTIPLEPALTAEVIETVNKYASGSDVGAADALNDSIDTATPALSRDGTAQDCVAQPALTKKVLRVMTPTNSIDLDITEGHDKQAQNFAHKLLIAAQDAPQAVEQHKNNIVVLKHALQETIENTHSIDQAKAALDADRKATGPIQMMQLQLQQVREQTPQDMLKSYDHHKTKKKILGWLTAIVVIAVIIAVIVLWIMSRFRN